MESEQLPALTSHTDQDLRCEGLGFQPGTEGEQQTLLADTESVRSAVCYEFPSDTTRSLEFALFRVFGVARGSPLLVKTGEFIKRTQKRYDDTVLILSEMLEHGLHSERGRAALRRMNQQHGRYPIPNDCSSLLTHLPWVIWEEYMKRPLTFFVAFTLLYVLALIAVLLSHYDSRDAFDPTRFGLPERMGQYHLIAVLTPDNTDCLPDDQSVLLLAVDSIPERVGEDPAHPSGPKLPGEVNGVPLRYTFIDMPKDRAGFVSTLTDIYCR